jgi:hypothetical protein
MGLTEYKCKKCQAYWFAFPEEKERILDFSDTSCLADGNFHDMEVMPPKASTVHSTEIFMLSQLDSIHSVHDLNSTLMREAEEEREVKQQNNARKEL